jgi:integrase
LALYQRPDSDYWWYRVEGSTTRRSTGVPHSAGNAKADLELRRRAELIYADAQSKFALQKAGVTKAEKPTITFRQFSQWYEKHVVAHQRGHERAASMLRQLSLYFDRFTDLQQVTQSTIREWMTWRRTRVAPATVNREFDVLKAMLRAAMPDYLDTNPMSELRRLRQPETEARVLTFEEERRLLDACGVSDRAFIVTALDTLLRLGSLLTLKWEQVKFDQRSIVPLNAKVKTRAKPITTRMYQALKAMPQTSPFVFAQFHVASRGKADPKNKATRRFDALCELAQVPHGRAVNGVTIHCLRHTGATRALQAGHSIRAVMDLGGWKNPQTVMRYLHAADIDVQAAAESIGSGTR